ncbi:hypothetical protein [Haladaptatus cibarius]|nr:hypothetical protein [Haladaptatus cibarius]
MTATAPASITLSATDCALHFVPVPRGPRSQVSKTLCVLQASFLVPAYAR